MDAIQELIGWFQILIPIGAAMRIAACLVYMTMEDDPTPYKKRIRNLLIFVVLAECVSGVIVLVADYFGGGVLF